MHTKTFLDHSFNLQDLEDGDTRDLSLNIVDRSHILYQCRHHGVLTIIIDHHDHQLKMMIITTITPRDTGVALNDLSWARFSAPRQQILLLPLEENIGLYNFRVQV